MTNEGSIAAGSLPEVLLELGREANTGILTIQGEGEIIAFSLLKGGVVSSDALNQTLEDGLGRVLSDLGLVTTHQFAELSAEYQAGGGQVSDLLVERGFVDREQLIEAIRTHTYQLCRQALGWKTGDFKFYRGEEVAYEDGVRPISPAELLVRAGSDLGVDFLPGELPSADEVFKRPRGGGSPEPATTDDSMDPFEALDAPALEAFESVDGKRSVADIAERAGLDPVRAAFLLSKWSETGLVSRTKRSRPKRREPVAAAALEPERISELSSPEALAAPKPPRFDLKAWWVARQARPAPDAIPWPSRAIGLALMLLLVVSFVRSPEGVLLPFPWQGGVQQVLEREKESASLARLRLANGAYFLLDGRYAATLEDLSRRKLLSAASSVGESGATIEYSATQESYVVRAAGGDAFLQETVRGNFLLDPELEFPAQSRRQPLVLLD